LQEKALYGKIKMLPFHASWQEEASKGNLGFKSFPCKLSRESISDQHGEKIKVIPVHACLQEGASVRLKTKMVA
jgi:hypothetical protein